MLTKVLWEQSNGSHKNYRIPALIVSKQNTILAFAEGRESGDAGNIDILLKRSKDNGNTWEDQIIVWDDAANTCGNPTPVIDQETGRIILFMTWNLGTDHEADIIRKKSESTRSPFMTYSDDDGLTWSKPKNLFESAKNPDWGWYATGPGVGIQLKSKKYEGRLIIPCNNSYDDPTITKRDGFGYGAHVLISDNAGLNWRLSESINPEVNESQVVELTDGSLIMNMRSYQGKSSRAISQSYDGGETWSAVTHDAALIDPVCQASFIAFGEFNKAPLFLFSNPASTNKRTNMTIKGSFDEAQTWANSRSIYEGPAAYSSLTKLPNGNIGLFFEAGENNPYEKMVFLSISPDELFDPQNSAQSVIGASLPIAIGWE
jgi:sialidase-1